MAITHADLEPSRSKKGTFVIILLIFLGLSCLTLCLVAEFTRSKVTWMYHGEKEDGDKFECVYNGNGIIPLLCAVSSIVVLAIAMVVGHVDMLIAASKSSPSSWDIESCSIFKPLKWRAVFFFFTLWCCFGIAEIFLINGVQVESGHLKNWSKPRSICYVMKERSFSAAGVLGLITAFLAYGIYRTFLRAQRIAEERENIRREIREVQASSFYASPPS